MKIAVIALVCVATFAAGARATEIGADAMAPAAAAERLAPEQVETLVAPIALYPDPLLAVILPAATRPSDIVLAMRYLESGGDPNAVDQQPWDDSVKALVRYREVLEYLDDNLEWTRSLGEAFLDQRDEVMAAVQTLRSRAHTQGMLASSSQQEVIVEEEEIRIVPAQPTVIYVPRYDPEVLYVREVHTYSYWPRPFITFGIGYSIGSWLSYDCDWRHRSIYIVHRPAYWYHRPDWRVRYVHRDRYPEYRWTHWAPRHDWRRDHHRGYRSTAHVVLHPQRRWDQPRPTRHSSGSHYEGSRYDGRRSYDRPRSDGQYYEGRRQEGQWNHSGSRGGGEREWGRRGDRVQAPAPVVQPMTAPQAVTAAPIVSAPQVVTQPAPRPGYARPDYSRRDDAPRREGASRGDWQNRERGQRPEVVRAPVTTAAPAPARVHTPPPAPQSTAAPHRGRGDERRADNPSAERGRGGDVRRDGASWRNPELRTHAN